jgi:hypothetical protein
VSLRYKPARGFAQTLRLAINGKVLQEARGGVQTTDVAATGRLRQAVEDVAADGTIRETITLLEGRATNFSFAEEGIPGPGETLRQTVSPLSKVLRVEGKEPGTPYYTKAVVYPEAPVALGGSWSYEDRLRTALGNLVQSTRCTLVGRERFRGEEAYRLQCQFTVAAAPGEKARYSVSGGAVVLIRARDGTPMYAESNGTSSGEVPGQDVKVSGETRAVIEEEAPAAGTAAR